MIKVRRNGDRRHAMRRYESRESRTKRYTRLRNG